MYHEFLFSPGAPQAASISHSLPCSFLPSAVFCDTSPHQSASTTPCLSGNHSLQGSHNTPKASLLLHETSSSYPSTAAKLQRLRQKTIELIHKQRVSRVIILHERCHPLVVCFMPHLHSFNNDWLFFRIADHIPHHHSE